MSNTIATTKLGIGILIPQGSLNKDVLKDILSITGMRTLEVNVHMIVNVLKGIINEDPESLNELNGVDLDLLVKLCRKDIELKSMIITLIESSDMILLGDTLSQLYYGLISDKETVINPPYSKAVLSLLSKGKKSDIVFIINAACQLDADVLNYDTKKLIAKTYYHRVSFSSLMYFIMSGEKLINKNHNPAFSYNVPALKPLKPEKREEFIKRFESLLPLYNDVIKEDNNKKINAFINSTALTKETRKAIIDSKIYKLITE